LNPHCWVQPWASCIHTCASVTKQYSLVPANGWWCSAAGEVTVSLAEINGSLPLGFWLQSPVAVGWLPRTAISSRTLCLFQLWDYIYLYLYLVMYSYCKIYLSALLSSVKMLVLEDAQGLFCKSLSLSYTSSAVSHKSSTAVYIVWWMGVIMSLV